MPPVNSATRGAALPARGSRDTAFVTMPPSRSRSTTPFSSCPKPAVPAARRMGFWNRLPNSSRERAWPGTRARRPAPWERAAGAADQVRRHRRGREHRVWPGRGRPRREGSVPSPRQRRRASLPAERYAGACFAPDHRQVRAVEIAALEKHSPGVSPFGVELLRGEHGFRRIGRIGPLVQDAEEDSVRQPRGLERVARRLAQQEETKIALRRPCRNGVGRGHHSQGCRLKLADFLRELSGASGPTPCSALNYRGQAPEADPLARRSSRTSCRLARPAASPAPPTLTASRKRARARAVSVPAETKSVVQEPPRLFLVRSLQTAQTIHQASTRSNGSWRPSVTTSESHGCVVSPLAMSESASAIACGSRPAPASDRRSSGSALGSGEPSRRVTASSYLPSARSGSSPLETVLRAFVPGSCSRRPAQRRHRLLRCCPA